MAATRASSASTVAFASLRAAGALAEAEDHRVDLRERLGLREERRDPARLEPLAHRGAGGPARAGHEIGPQREDGLEARDRRSRRSAGASCTSGGQSQYRDRPTTRVARADHEQRLGRRRRERHDARRRARHRRVAGAGVFRQPERRTSDEDETAREDEARAARSSAIEERVLVELLDERRARDAEAARGLALVLARRLELGGDDRALEALDARAQRMARARIARQRQRARSTACPRRASATARA